MQKLGREGESRETRSTIPDVELTDLDIRQLESSSEHLHPRASAQADVTSERDSDSESDSTGSGSYAGESGELSEEDQRPT